MQSVIERKDILSKVLTQYGAHELYANQDFTLGCDKPKLAVLVKQDASETLLYTSIIAVFDIKTVCSITTDPHALCLQGLKIVWRDGTWYVS